MIKSTNFTPKLYTAIMPNDDNFNSVYPLERQLELDGVKNAKVKAQKYWVWKLLERAIEHSFKKRITEFKLIKQNNGKWTCSEFFFSLSHSKNILAVAISLCPVGVDVEKILVNNKKAIERTFTQAEKLKYSSIEKEECDEFLITCWSKKESAFKMSGEEKFLPSKIDGNGACSTVKKIEIDGENFIITACNSDKATFEFYEWVELND